MIRLSDSCILRVVLVCACYEDDLDKDRYLCVSRTNLEFRNQYKLAGALYFSKGFATQEPIELIEYRVDRTQLLY